MLCVISFVQQLLCIYEEIKQLCVCNFMQCMDQGHLDDQLQVVRVYKTIYINSN